MPHKLMVVLHHRLPQLGHGIDIAGGPQHDLEVHVATIGVASTLSGAVATGRDKIREGWLRKRPYRPLSQPGSLPGWARAAVYKKSGRTGVSPTPPGLPQTLTLSG